MSYNGSGTFNINTTGQPVVTGTVISSTAFNALTSDLGTGLSTAITKDGQTVATARIPFAQGINSSLVTDATNTTTGSIITAGGVGIAKALFVGTTLNVAGASTLAAITGTFNGTVGATTPSTGAFTTVTATGTGTFSGTLKGTANVWSEGAGSDTAAAGNLFMLSNGAGGGSARYWATQQSSSGAAKVDYYFNGTSWAQISSVSSTGLAVTGTGTFSNTVTVNTTNDALQLQSAATNASVINLGVVASTYTYLQTAKIGTGTTRPFRIYSDSAQIAEFSSTGLAVTGTLSAGDTTITGASALTINRSGAQAQIALQNNGTTTGILIAGASNGLVFYDNGAGQQIGTWAYAAGLAVTGALSATGNITGSGRVFLGGATVTTGSNSNELIIGNNTSIRSQNAAGTAAIHLISASTTDAISIALSGGAINFGAGIVTMPGYGAGAATFSSAGVISSVSDETWKVKDGAPVDTDAMLNKLEPGYWYYNDEKKETFGKDRQLGFYAQNVNAAIGPEAAPEPETVVTKNDDGTETSVTKPWGYYDRSVLAVAVMSLQKALATIESLTARITALEAK